MKPAAHRSWWSILCPVYIYSKCSNSLPVISVILFLSFPLQCSSPPHLQILHVSYAVSSRQQCCEYGAHTHGIFQVSHTGLDGACRGSSLVSRWQTASGKSLEKSSWFLSCCNGFRSPSFTQQATSPQICLVIFKGLQSDSGSQWFKFEVDEKKQTTTINAPTLYLTVPHGGLLFQIRGCVADWKVMSQLSHGERNRRNPPHRFFFSPHILSLRGFSTNRASE